jgi:hypothetical protein
MSSTEAPTMEQLLRQLDIKPEEVYYLQPGADQIEAVFPDMSGMAARVIKFDFALALGRRYIIVPPHQHSFGQGRSPKTKLYSLRHGHCVIAVFRGGKFQFRHLIYPFDKAVVEPGEWHAMIISEEGGAVDVTLSEKDNVPPIWTPELAALLLTNPTKYVCDHIRCQQCTTPRTLAFEGIFILKIVFINLTYVDL